MPPSLDTPLTRLRRLAPGSLTQADILGYMRKKGLRRDQVTVSDFERGKYMPAAPFSRHYADAIGQKHDAVLAAWEEARKGYRRREAKASKKTRR